VILFGVRLVGLNEQTTHKIVLTFLFLAAVMSLRWIFVKAILFVARKYRNERLIFWQRQAASLVTAVLSLLIVLSIWFDDPARLATGIGLVSAGLAFALQKVVTSAAGYIVIMRGRTFSVGDRITMGGVRGDVIALGFIQTQIMEMGQPPSVSALDPPMWIHGRQYTGRIVTVSNDKVFDEPVYNYTRDFPFIWEEIRIPVKYTTDRALAEKILLAAAGLQTEQFQAMSEPALRILQQKYFISADDLAPRVFYRLTDNWLELALRFIVTEHGVRNIKDAINRDILRDFDIHQIEIASATFELVGLPEVKFRAAPSPESLATCPPSH
jgi:small-conductance mechanosensitive channel